MAGILDLLDPAELRKLAVWTKGTPLPNYDPNEWRMDDYGNVIRLSDHGDRQSAFGWEVDHIRPSALGGGDELTNLRPLHFTTNARLGGILGALHRA